MARKISTAKLIKDWADQETEISMYSLNREMRGYVNALKVSNEKKISELKRRGVSTERDYLSRASMNTKVKGAVAG